MRSTKNNKKVTYSSKGFENRIAVVEKGLDRSVIKYYRNERSYSNELHTVLYLTENGIHAPDVLNHGRKGSIHFIEFAYISCEMVATMRYRDLDWLVPLLRPLFAIEGPGFGPFIEVRNGNGFRTWQDYLADRLGHYYDVLTSGEDENRSLMCEVLEVLGACLSKGFETQAYLTHHDLKPENIVWGSDVDRPLLLDWEGAIWGDPCYDIAKLWWRSRIPPIDPFVPLVQKVNSVSLPETEIVRRLEYYRCLNALRAYIASVNTKNPLYGGLRSLAWEELANRSWTGIT